jgi:glycosyltransferase 2 family protein
VPQRRLAARSGSLLRPVLAFLKKHWLETVGVGSLIVLAIVVHPLELWGVLSKVHIVFLLLMLPVVLAVYVLRAIGWWVALRTAGVEITLFRAIYTTIAGHLMVFMPAGDLARAALVRKIAGADEGRVAGTIAFQELTYLTLLGLGVVPQLLVHPDIAMLFLLMLIGHATAFLIVLWEPAYKWAVGLVERIRWLRRFDKQLRTLRPAFVAQVRSPSLIAVLGLNALAAAFLLLLFYLALVAVGGGRIGFVDAAFVYGLAHIFSGLSFLPGGIGSLEAILTALLAAHGLPASEGAACALLFRGYNDVVMLGFAWIGVILVRRRAGEPAARKRRRRRRRPTPS